MSGARRIPVQYEARPTRMFGAYTIWVTYADGSAAQIAHGTPHHCLAEAARLNESLADQGRRPPPAT